MVWGKKEIHLEENSTIYEDVLQFNTLNQHLQIGIYFIKGKGKNKEKYWGLAVKEW